MARFAAVDVGTNSALLSVVERTSTGIHVLEERCEVPRLGQDLDRAGVLSPNAADRTLSVLADYAQAARHHGAILRAVATQALREARGTEDFLARARECLGTALEVIDGTREASLAFRAAMESFPQARLGRCVVIDVGGGSTEIIHGERGRVESLVSVPMGSVRLTERALTEDPPSSAAIARAGALCEAAFSDLTGDPLAVVIGIAGTVTTLASVALALQEYDAERVQGFRLPLTEIERQIDGYATMPTLARRALQGMDPRRADVILAGALIVRAILRRLGAQELLVSDRGVRWGLLHEMMEPGA